MGGVEFVGGDHGLTTAEQSDVFQGIRYPLL